VLVADLRTWLGPRIVARTSANGAYRVRDVSPELSVTARAGNLAPALLRPLRGRSGRVRVDFTLGELGAGLRGVVRDPEGRPVAGAYVAVGDPEGWVDTDPQQPEVYLGADSLRIERTDALGRFFAAGVRPGFGLEVAVQADPYPLAVANVSATAGVVSYVELALVEPATLTGVVRTSSGEPVAGASLGTVLFEGAGSPEVAFSMPHTWSDAEGRFRLGPLPRSSRVLLAPPRGGPGAPTLVPLELPPGETIRDLVLAADDTLRGRVVAAPDVRFDGWFVQVRHQFGGGRMKRAPLAADGRFELAGCAQPPYRVELYAATNRPVLRWDEVGPGEELVLVAEPLGSIRGEFVDEAGVLPEGLRPEVLASFREFVDLAPTVEDEGRFAFELLRPGRYRLRIAADELYFATTVEVAPGATVDLGRIALRAPGSLRLTLDPPSAAGVSGRVLDASFEACATLELADGQLGVAALPPGEHLLVLEGPALASRILPFTIRSGERTELVAPTEPGVERSLAFLLRGRAWEVLTVELRDARGELVLHRRIQRRYWPSAGGTPTLLASLAVGTYALAAETDSGLGLRTSLDVPALEAQAGPLTFELR
jgi:hypothetical protein